VLPEEVGRHIIGDIEVEVAVSIEIGGDHTQAPAYSAGDPRLLRNIDKMPAVVAEEAVGKGLEFKRIAGDVRARLPIPAEPRVLLVPFEIVTDIEVEVAVSIEIGKGGGGRPITIA